MGTTTIGCWIAAIGLALVGPPGGPVPAARMADGKIWTTRNVDADVTPSYCYDGAAARCATFGRLYSWDSAQRACQALGPSWRLPTNEEWRALASAYGGLLEESPDKGKAAYAALVAGGRSGFAAVLGGGRDLDGTYARGDAHGFYWTATEHDAGTAWFYNFGRGIQALSRIGEGEKARGFAVRCIRD
jgi:uncharacterized protein (TIGR02145 family)